jgi:hypothetical protein
VSGNEPERQVQGHDRERQRDHEHGTPVELREQGAREQRSERGDRASEARPQRDRFRASGTRPERRDQGKRRRVGHTGGQTADEPRDEEDLDGRSEGGEQGGGNRQGSAENEHELAPVAVTQRSEVEHRRCQSERVAHGNQVELGLSRVERLADVRQRHIGHSQVQVRDRGDKDERDEDQARTRWRSRRLAGRAPI